MVSPLIVYGQKLNPQECRILSLAAVGLSNAQIAKRVELTEATVKTYMVRTAIKLGTCNRTQAVVLSIAMGYIGLPPVREIREAVNA